MNNPYEPKRAALYIRVSTEEQARHGLSLAEQKSSLEAYAAQHQFKIAGFYEDAGISARKPYKKRPALLRLLDDCKTGKIDIILFIKLDRWFRNVGNYYAVQEILDQCNVSWQATQEDYETTTAAGRLKVNIMLSVAQDEADRTSERIKFVFEGKRARLEPITGHAPTGYRIENKKIVKDEATEKIIDALFQKFLQTGSISETQQYLDAVYNYHIDYQLTSKILHSTAYYGFWHGVDRMCEPYITKEQYDKIQSMRTKVVRKVKENRVYLFSGLILCGECGNRMVGRTNNRSGTVNYCCPNYHEKRRCNNNIYISEKKIEAYLIDTLDRKFQEYKANLQRLCLAAEQSSNKAQITSIKHKLSKLKDLYLNDLITLDEYKQDQESMKAKLAELEKVEVVPKTDNLDKIGEILSQDWKSIYEQLPRAEKRNFWRILISAITVQNDRSIDYILNA